MNTQTGTATQSRLHDRFQWHASTLADATSGTWHGKIAPDVSCERICTDTRKIKTGDVFLALKGDNFDGHDYVAQAQTLGAAAAVVSRVVSSAALPQLHVADTRSALGSLGAYVRAQNPELKVVALTGSSGKTTTKELLGSILSQVDKTLITRGNLNNDLGVPMMLLELGVGHKFAVLELGANHVGEIAYTANLVKPDVACVLNVGSAHLGEFGGRDAICTAKSEIFSALGAAGIAVLPADDDYAEALEAHARAHTTHVIRFCTKEPTPTGLFAKHIRTLPASTDFELHMNNQNVHVALNLAGEHNVSNALAAAACAHALGVDIQTIAAGLSKVQPPKGRLEQIKLGNHTLIDDTYNANPQAVLAAANVLLAQGDKSTMRVLVLGDIGELGEQAPQEHAKLGEALSKMPLGQVVCVGELMAHTAKALHENKQSVQHFPSKALALDHIRKLLVEHSDVAMLFKGSRTAKMETLIEDIMQKQDC